MKRQLVTMTISILFSTLLFAQAKPADTEFYSPVPPVVSPAKAVGNPPADAIILFNGKNMDQWVLLKDSTSQKKWKLDGDKMTVDKKAGDIRTKQSFMDFQMHIEYLIPKNITGKNQARGNSGVFLAAPEGQEGYELQVLDNFNNDTYVNGQAGSIYKQSVPLVNACRPPGEWQSYDVVWTAPRFNEDGTLKSPARVTAFHNGLLVQNNFELRGGTPYIGQPVYKAHGPAPIKLQAHGDPSEPISFRNIWVREL
jgi:Domain of Unknown Function (DUF1080).